MHTVSQVFDRFEADELPGLAERTRIDYVRHIRILRQQFGTSDLRELRRSQVLTFLSGSKAPIQRNRAVSVFSSALTAAVKWGWVDSNVCKGVPRNKPQKRDRQLVLQEFEDFKKKAPVRIRLAMDLARLTEQGQSAVVGLRWSHVNEERNVILFRQTKTNKKIEVPITQALRTVLDQCKKFRKGEYVISKTAGGRYTSEGFRAGWQRTIRSWENTGNDRFTFHDISKLAKASRSAAKPAEAEDSIAGYPQFDEVVRAEAAQMSRHYKVFYCLEQSIRKLIVNTLEKSAGEEWWNRMVNQQIRQEVDVLVGKEIDSGMKQRSDRMIDYTTFGQLSQIIIQNWNVFDKLLTSAKAVGKVMASLNLLRGPIAHCCPISAHEAERLEFAVRDWFNILL